MAIVLASLLVLGLAPLTALAANDIYRATISIPIYSKTIAIPANTPYVINVTVPEGVKADAIKVIIVDYTESIQLKAYEGSTKIADITVVPLSTGFSTVLPANTTTIELSNPTQVWEGTITVLVETSVEFQVTPPSTIIVRNGTGTGNMYVKQVSGPAGKIFLLDDSLDFDVSFRDPEPEYPGDYVVETTGAGWSANIPVVVTSTAKPGTYSIKIQMWYSPLGDVGVQPTLVATFNLSLDTSAGGLSGSISEVKEWLKDKWMYIGAGLIILILLFMLVPKRRIGMAGLSGNLFTLLLFLLVIVMGVTIAFLDQVHATALGIGVGAFLILLLLLQSGKLKLA
ncbi:MAG: hypothetical protein QXT64_05050 [Desulfurococcaceae archaeon]